MGPHQWPQLFLGFVKNQDPKASKESPGRTPSKILYIKKKYNKKNYVVVSSKGWDQNVVSLIHLWLHTP
jgi:hypothetical protein